MTQKYVLDDNYTESTPLVLVIHQPESSAEYAPTAHIEYLVRGVRESGSGATQNTWVPDSIQTWVQSGYNTTHTIVVLNNSQPLPPVLTFTFSGFDSYDQVIYEGTSAQVHYGYRCETTFNNVTGAILYTYPVEAIPQE